MFLSRKARRYLDAERPASSSEEEFISEMLDTVIPDFVMLAFCVGIIVERFKLVSKLFLFIESIFI